MRPRPVAIDDEVLSFAKFAIEDYNSKNCGSLELKRVRSAKRHVAGFMYTFGLDVVAGDGSAKDDRYVVTEVWYKASDDSKEVVHFHLMSFTEDDLIKLSHQQWLDRD